MNALGEIPGSDLPSMSSVRKRFDSKTSSTPCDVGAQIKARQGKNHREAVSVKSSCMLDASGVLVLVCNLLTKVVSILCISPPP